MTPMHKLAKNPDDKMVFLLKIIQTYLDNLENFA